MQIPPVIPSISAAGAPLAQARGTETERVQQQAAAHARQNESAERAANAAGIAATDGDDHETHERDADGRRFWEAPPQVGGAAQDAAAAGGPSTQSKDATGACGHSLDLTG